MNNICSLLSLFVDTWHHVLAVVNSAAGGRVLTAHISSKPISLLLDVYPSSRITGSCGSVIYFNFQV